MPHRIRSVVFLILLGVFNPGSGWGDALALDESASLALLVRTLDQTDDNTIRSDLLRGILSGLDGRRDISAPVGWDALNAKLLVDSNPDVIKLTRQLGQVFGDAAATEYALSTLRDSSRPIDDRRAALKSLVTQQDNRVLPELQNLLDQPDMRLDAIRAYGAFLEPSAPATLLKRYTAFDAVQKRAVIETLATRKEYAADLVKAIAKQTVPKGDIPTYVARSLQTMLGEPFTEVYGDIRELSADKTQLIAKYKAMLTPAELSKANASRGRGVYQRTCAACHLMYGEGGLIGPELTGSNRADLDYILLNMVDPNDDVPEGYRLVTITTKDGQVLAGNIAEEDAQRVVLRMVGQESVVLKSDIASRTVVPFSLMPEGQLLTMTDGEVADLIKYLRTNKQVEAPK